MVYAFLNIVFQKGYYIVLTFLKILVTYICGNSETRRNRYSNQIHLCEVSTLSAKQVAHIGATFSFSIAKSINSFFNHS